MQQVRFGIVGVGNMGSAHLSHILRGNVPELKVTAVADINPARLKAAKAAAEKAGQPIEGFPQPRRFLKAAMRRSYHRHAAPTTTPRSLIERSRTIFTSSRKSPRVFTPNRCVR